MQGFRDQPVLMGSVTRRQRLLLPFCSVPVMLFLPFLGGREHGAEVALAHFNSVVTAVAVTPLSKSQGAHSTVGHLASYLTLFPFPSRHGWDFFLS